METATKTQPTTKFKEPDIHQLVTDTIVQQLEAGVIPWQKPFKGSDQAFTIPKNAVTANKYRGINIVLLWCANMKNGYQTNEWASFKQWQQKNETINKGQKGSVVVYYDIVKKEIEGEIQEIPFLKSSYVFNRCQLASYVEPEETEQNDPVFNYEHIEAAHNFVIKTGVIINQKKGEAFYNPESDEITMPLPKQFKDTDNGTATENYIATLSHEMIHWTGAETRLKRDMGKKFGDQKYAAEELVAELGAAFLCAGFGLPTVEKGNHAGYIDLWLQVFKDNKQILMSAASEASKAFDYLHALQPK